MAFPIGLLFPSDLEDAVQGAAVIVTPATGAILASITSGDPATNVIPYSSVGDILPNGVFALGAEFNTPGNVGVGAVESIALYTSAGSLIANVSSIIPDTDDFVFIRGDGAHLFYVAVFADAANTLYTISDAGVIGGTTWTFPFSANPVQGMAVSWDGTILYWVNLASPFVIHRYDLIAMADLPDLVTGPTNSQARFDSLFILSDGSLIISGRANTADQGSYTIWRYSPVDGTLLNTFARGHGGQFSPIELGVDPASPGTFWDKSFSSDGTTTTVQKTRVSDGSTLITWTASTLSGAGQIPVSCPVIMLQSVVATLTVIKAIDPPGDVTTDFPFTTTGGLSPASFDLVGGGSQVFSGLSPGTYGVAETPPPGWILESAVASNADPINAIVLSGGDSVTVTFTNKFVGGVSVPGLMTIGKLHVYGYAQKPSATAAPLALVPGTRLDIFPTGLPHHQLLGVKQESSQPLGNPFVSDKNSYYSAYVVPEPIDLQAFGAGIDAPARLTDVLPLDPRIQSLQQALVTVQQAIATQVATASGQVNAIRNVATGLPLGGSLTIGSTNHVFTDVPNALPLRFASASLGTILTTVVVTVRTDGAGGAVTAQLVNATTGAVAAVGTAYAGSSPVTQRIPCTLAGALSEYRLQVSSSDGRTFVYGLGYVELQGLVAP